MELDNNNRRYFYKPLNEVFTFLFNVKQVREVYDACFYQALKEPQPKKAVTKPVMVEQLCRLSETPKRMQQFVDAFSDKERQLYTKLLWDDGTALPSLEKELGFIIHSDRIENDWQKKYHVYTMAPDFQLACLVFDKEAHYNSWQSDAREDPVNYTVSIPPAIRRWLTPYFPKPEGYTIKALADDSYPQTNQSVFDASPSICNDLAQLSDFLERGTVTRTKKGDFTKATLRKAEKLITSGDWYPDKKAHPELNLMRIGMLLDFIGGFMPKTNKQLTARKPKSRVFKDLLQEIKEDEEMLSKWLLEHLKHRFTYYEETYESDAIDALFGLFKQMPRKGWVSLENIKQAQLYQDIDILFFDPKYYSFRTMRGSKGYRYEDEIDLSQKHLKKVGIEPLIDGLTFLLSAFGYLKLAYQAPPPHPIYGKEKHPYLTRYDGAVAVSLTDIGAFVFGQSASLELKQGGRQLATVTPHTEHLHVICQNLDPITEQTLQEYMECIGPNFYKLTRSSILKGCQCPDDVKHRVKDFEQRMPFDFPKNWQLFLTTLKKEKSALIEEPLFSVFTLAGRPELQQLFLKDAVLRGMTWRVEGHRVAMERQNIPKVRAHLRKLGYLV